MALNENHLVWLDMEMTGLDPEKERIIEVAVVVTDAQLEVVAEGPVLVLHQPDALLDGMDAWNKATHGRSGLRRLTMGSVALQVVHRAQCPVLVRRPPMLSTIVTD